MDCFPTASWSILQRKNTAAHSAHTTEGYCKTGCLWTSADSLVVPWHRRAKHHSCNVVDSLFLLPSGWIRPGAATSRGNPVRRAAGPRHGCSRWYSPRTWYTERRRNPSPTCTRNVRHRSLRLRTLCAELRSCLKPLRPVRTLSVIPRSDASQALLVTTETGSHKADRATSVSRGDSYKNASLENQ